MKKNYLIPQKQSFPQRSRYFLIAGLCVAIGFSSNKFLKSSFDSHSFSLDQMTRDSLSSPLSLEMYLTTLSPVQKKEIDLIARTVFGEARGEKSFDSLQAIAHVILNRVKDHKNWPNSVEAVIFQKNQFSCWNETDPNYFIIQSVSFNNPEFRQAYQATLAAMLSQQDITHGANHYHARWVDPTWAHQKNMIRVAEIQQHIFYKA